MVQSTETSCCKNDKHDIINVFNVLFFGRLACFLDTHNLLFLFCLFFTFLKDMCFSVSFCAFLFGETSSSCVYVFAFNRPYPFYLSLDSWYLTLCTRSLF